MTTNNTKATYTFVHPVISKDSYAVSMLLPIITFSQWDNKEAILSTFTFLQEYNITTIKGDVPIFKDHEEERQYRKDIFGLRYCRWMKYIFNHYRAYNVQSDIGNERALLFSQAKKAALTIMSIVRNEDLVVMTKEEFNTALANAQEAGRIEAEAREQDKSLDRSSEANPVEKVQEEADTFRW
jgi:hypothetical protein